MRDNHEGMPELLQPEQESDQYFAVIKLEEAGRSKRFRFEVTRGAFVALCRARNLRPFDTLPGTDYRYFFVYGCRSGGGNEVQMTVRVEAGGDGKQFELDAPYDLVSSLLWFAQLENWEDAKAFAIDDVRGDKA